MPRFDIPPSQRHHVKVDGTKRPAITKGAFESFNISVLGLGDVSVPSEATDAVAAVFDLAGFTNFCKQIDPHLSVPHYLNEFLTWLMKQLREEMRQSEEKKKGSVLLWCPMPFFVKFLGDGLLVLWNSEVMNDNARRNVLLQMRHICANYVNEFLPTVRDKPNRRLDCAVDWHEERFFQSGTEKIMLVRALTWPLVLKSFPESHSVLIDEGLISKTLTLDSWL